MIIGIDLRALQTGHKFRGIGEVAKQVTNQILAEASSEASPPAFLFYEYDGDDPKELLSIPKSIKYEVLKLGKMPESDLLSKKDKLRRHLGDIVGSPVSGSKRADVFLQFDYNFGVPKNTKTLLIKHDLIPLIFWKQFFESPLTHIRHKAARTTIRTIFNNFKYMRVLNRSVNNAKKIIAVSNSTKNDLVTRLKVPVRKIRVAHHGVSSTPARTNQVSTNHNMPTKPYLLFVGAGDARRRVQDAVTAFNNLKAEGHDIQLALVGENFQTPENIPTIAVRKAVLNSSYKNDIYLMGYVDDPTKQLLYRQAIAYVYPTLYEGFGIPILEAMLLRCPVIVYKNSSTEEVGGSHAFYANDWQDIKKQVISIMNMEQPLLDKRKDRAEKYAQQFTWDKTAHIIYDELKSIA